MAVKYAVATGNRSNTAIRNGGTLPGALDDVYANGYTVTVNQNITVAKISTEVCPTTGTAGGFFLGADITINGNVVAGTTRCFGTNVSGAYVIVYGDVYGGSGNGAYGIFTLTGAGHIHTVYGNIYGGSNSTAYGEYMVNGILYLTGDVVGGVGYGIYLANGMNATIIGNVLSGGLFCYYNNTVYVTGNVVAGASMAINHANSLQILLSIVGNVIASSTAFGIETTSTVVSGLIEITGEVIASSAKSGIYNTGRTLTVNGNIVNSDGVNAIFSQSLTITPTSTTVWTVQDGAFNDINLYTSDVFVGIPAEADVRDGEIFGVANEKTGTLAVPSPSNVADGVPTDDTVGTADFAMSDVLTALGVVNVGVQKASKLIPHSTDI